MVPPDALRCSVCQLVLRCCDAIKMRTEIHMRQDRIITSTWQSITDEEFDSIRDMVLDRLQNGTGVIVALAQIGDTEWEVYVPVSRIDYLVVETYFSED